MTLVQNFICKTNTIQTPHQLKPRKASGFESLRWSQPPTLPFHLDPGLSLGLSTTTCSILCLSLPKGGHSRAALGEGVNEQQVWETESISTPSKGSLSPNHSPTESRVQVRGDRGVPKTCSCSPGPDTDTPVVSDLTHYGKWTGLLSGLLL